MQSAVCARQNVSVTQALPLPANLVTPCLVVDRDVLERNLVAMADRARDQDVALRPHAKTHKCLEIARRQVALGAAGLTVATVGEAEVFADAGFTDLFIAYPVWAEGSRGRRLRAVAERVALRVGADSSEGVELLARALVGTSAEVVIEVDSGHHRTGVEPERAGDIAVAAQRLGLPVVGCSPSPATVTGPARSGRLRRMRGRPCSRRRRRCVGPGWTRVCAAADRHRPPLWWNRRD